MNQFRKTLAFCAASVVILSSMAVLQANAANSPAPMAETAAFDTQGGWHDDTSGSSSTTVTPSVRVSTTTVKAGETGSITVSMDSNPGLVSWKFLLDYDSNAIEITGITPGAFKNASCGSLNSDPFAFYWNDNSKGNNTSNGTIATISFKVKPEAAPGSYNLTLSGSAADIYNASRTRVKFNYGTGRVNVTDNPALKNPTVSYTPGDSSVKLSWTSVPTAQKYAVVAYLNGNWKTLAEGNTNTYTVRGLTAGNQYKVAVLAYVYGGWNTRDFSKAIYVTPNAAAAYPKVSSQVQGNTFKLSWTAVSGAQGYAVGYQKGGKWKILKSVSASTTSYSQSGVPLGTYKVAVIAKKNGNWDTSAIAKSATTITIR